MKSRINIYVYIHTYLMSQNQRITYIKILYNQKLKYYIKNGNFYREQQRFYECILSINVLLAAVASYKFIYSKGIVDDCELRGTDCLDRSAASFYGI